MGLFPSNALLRPVSHSGNWLRIIFFKAMMPFVGGVGRVPSSSGSPSWATLKPSIWLAWKTRHMFRYNIGITHSPSPHAFLLSSHLPKCSWAPEIQFKRTKSRARKIPQRVAAGAVEAGSPGLTSSAWAPQALLRMPLIFRSNLTDQCQIEPSLAQRFPDPHFEASLRLQPVRGDWMPEAYGFSAYVHQLWWPLNSLLAKKSLF